MQKLIFLFILSISFSLSISAQNPKSAKITLPNGWSLSPAGHGYLLGDLPLNMAVSNSKKLLAVTNNGQSTQSIQLIDCLLYTSPSPRDGLLSRMPSSA